MKLVRVEQSHVDIIYEWANDPVTRMYSFHKDVISYEQHVEWFQRKIKDTNCRFYICQHDNDLIGQIRVDFENGKGIVSYCVAPLHRGCGYGSQMLRMLQELLSNDMDVIPITILQGKVLHQNVASQKCFLNCDYDRSERDEYILFTKKIR